MNLNNEPTAYIAKTEVSWGIWGIKVRKNQVGSGKTSFPGLFRLWRSSMQPPDQPLTSPFPILIGSTFPLSLVRRRVVIEPLEQERVRLELQCRPFASFWGHVNTLAAANSMLGADVTPRTERPAVALDPNQFPALDGVSYRECFILSPDYAPGFRPKVGEELGPDKIAGWQALRMRWE